MQTNINITVVADTLKEAKELILEEAEVILDTDDLEILGLTGNKIENGIEWSAVVKIGSVPEFGALSGPEPLPENPFNNSMLNDLFKSFKEGKWNDSSEDYS